MTIYNSASGTDLFSAGSGAGGGAGGGGTEEVFNGGVLSTSTVTSTINVTNGQTDNLFVVPPGDFSGQTKLLVMAEPVVGEAIVQYETSTGVETKTFTSADDNLTLLWNGTSWAEQNASGGTLIDINALNYTLENKTNAESPTLDKVVTVVTTNNGTTNFVTLPNSDTEGALKVVIAGSLNGQYHMTINYNGANQVFRFIYNSQSVHLVWSGSTWMSTNVGVTI